jgi:hypothetical protein
MRTHIYIYIYIYMCVLKVRVELKVHGSVPGGCAMSYVLKKISHTYPETANVRGNCVTLHAQNRSNCAIYPISN